MRRILSLIIMALYLLPAFGMTVSAHYCGGKLADVSLFGSKPKMNCSCGTKNDHKQVLLKNKCCEQFIYSLKLDNQQLKQSAVGFKIPNAAVPVETFFWPDLIQYQLTVLEKEVLCYFPDLPPGRYKIPVYIQNDSFLL